MVKMGHSPALTSNRGQVMTDQGKSVGNAAWRQRDLAHLWHPCTQMKDHEWLPLIPMRRGRGAWLQDYDGNWYLDVISSWWVNLFGHANPTINAAIAEQLEQIEQVMLAGYSHAPAIELAERLARVAPAGLDRVFFADNGSAGVEVALKLSYHYWLNSGQGQRKRFVCLSNSYHGETLGALSVSDVGLYRDTYAPLLLERLVAPSPDCFQREPGMDWETHSRQMFEPMRALLHEHAAEICAVIVEPLVQCAGGMRMYHPVYLQLLRATCDELGIHLIADEIATGFGRTGTLFACEQAGISPDFLCLSKGLTGGYLPLSAVVLPDRVYRAFYDDFESMKAFLHSHSYTGNPLACRAALATLNLFETSDVIGENRRKSKLMGDSVAGMADHPQVGELRQTGMILAMEMVADKQACTPYPWQQRRGVRAYLHALEQGVLLRPLGNVSYFMPPYVVSDEEIEWMGQVACESIDAATRD